MHVIRLFFIALASFWSISSFALEYPIGTPQNLAGMEIAAVYLQPVEMEPEGHMRKASESDIHLEAVLTGLATYRFQGGQVVHLNLGGVRIKAQGERDTRGTWGLGYEHPLLDKLKLTAEIYGEQYNRPDKAVGLRYEILEGLKISGAIGRGNDRSFGQAAISWEF